MRRRPLTPVLALITALLGATLLATAGVGAGDRSVGFIVDLTGAAEIPGPGDEDGFGSARLRIFPDDGVLCYTLRVRKIEPATAAHVHEIDPANEGTPAEGTGPVLIGLTAPTSGVSNACLEGLDPADLQGIVDDPAEYYVNVHNTPFPAGALRGDLE